MGGRYRVMLRKMCLSKGSAGIRSTHLAPLSKTNSNQRELAIKAEEDATVFEEAIQKLTGKNDMPTGEVLRQIGIFDNDVVSYVHSLNKQFKSFFANFFLSI